MSQPQCLRDPVWLAKDSVVRRKKKTFSEQTDLRLLRRVVQINCEIRFVALLIRQRCRILCSIRIIFKAKNECVWFAFLSFFFTVKKWLSQHERQQIDNEQHERPQLLHMMHMKRM